MTAGLAVTAPTGARAPDAITEVAADGVVPLLQAQGLAEVLRARALEILFQDVPDGLAVALLFDQR